MTGDRWQPVKKLGSGRNTDYKGHGLMEDGTTIIPSWSWVLETNESER